MSRSAASPGRRLALDAPAKLNLHLEVLRRREDGYHEIETILQAVDLCDRLRLELRDAAPGAGPSVALEVDPPDAAPSDESNLCVRAARRFCAETGLSAEIDMRLTKAIPAGAGLGGGSADAAAVLVGLDRLLGTRLEREGLERLGATLGADVPFFIGGGTQLGRGIGTDLRKLAGPRRGRFLILKPPLDIDTANAYRGLNMGLTARSPKVNIRRAESLLARMPQGAWFGVNRLEEAVLPAHPELQRVLIALQERAAFAMMTGSGSALFAICKNGREGEALARDLPVEGWFVRIAGPRAQGVTIRED